MRLQGGRKLEQQYAGAVAWRGVHEAGYMAAYATKKWPWINLSTLKNRETAATSASRLRAKGMDTLVLTGVQEQC